MEKNFLSKPATLQVYTFVPTIGISIAQRNVSPNLLVRNSVRNCPRFIVSMSPICKTEHSLHTLYSTDRSLRSSPVSRKSFSKRSRKSFFRKIIFKKYLILINNYLIKFGKFNIFVHILPLFGIKLNKELIIFQRMKTRTPFKQLSNEINDSLSLSLSLSSASFRKRGKRKSILNEAKVSHVSVKWRFLREVRIRCFEDRVIHP